MRCGLPDEAGAYQTVCARAAESLDVQQPLGLAPGGLLFYWEVRRPPPPAPRPPPAERDAVHYRTAHPSFGWENSDVSLPPPFPRE